MEGGRGLVREEEIHIQYICIYILESGRYVRVS